MACSLDGEIPVRNVVPFLHELLDLEPEEGSGVTCAGDGCEDVLHSPQSVEALDLFGVRGSHPSEHASMLKLSRGTLSPEPRICLAELRQHACAVVPLCPGKIIDCPCGMDKAHPLWDLRRRDAVPVEVLDSFLIHSPDIALEVAAQEDNTRTIDRTHNIRSSGQATSRSRVRVHEIAYLLESQSQTFKSITRHFSLPGCRVAEYELVPSPGQQR